MIEVRAPLARRLSGWAWAGFDQGTPEARHIRVPAAIAGIVAVDSTHDFTLTARHGAMTRGLHRQDSTHGFTLTA